MQRRLVLGLMILAAAGCGDAPPPPAPAGPLADAAVQFDPATAGTVSGRVTWDGDLPDVAPFRAPAKPLSEAPPGKSQLWPNPHAPVIDPSTRGVAGTIVFLRGVDARRSCPWPHSPVTVEQRDYQIHVLQGDADRPTGFVRRGTAVAFTSAQPIVHSLQARGAAFFSLVFPPDAQACARTLERCGVVELSSGMGYFWMRAHLFVDDHPYYTHTDHTGRFTLGQVPPGRYEVVCWQPDWHEAGHELDADNGLVTRLSFRPAVTATADITVEPGGKVETNLRLGPGLFGR
jgi:hypothetical protein